MENTNKNTSKKYVEPHFNFEDLHINDIREDNYKDPYYGLRRPIEPERLQSIYQQAFIYDLLYNFAKEFLPEIEHVGQKAKEKNDTISSSSKTAHKTTDTTIDTIKDKVLEYLFKNHPRVDENELGLTDPKIHKEKHDDPKTGSSIWDTNDMNVLRKTFQGVKENNHALKSRLTVIQDEYNELKAKHEHLKLETQAMPNAIKTLEKENERLYIRMQDLESGYAIYSRDLQNADKLIKSHQEEKYELNKSIQQLTSDKFKLEYEVNKLQQKLASIKSEFKLYYLSKVDSLKLKYAKEIEFLKKRFFELNEKYKSKKSQLEKNQKALDHLRSHFATTYTSSNANALSEKVTDKIGDNQIKIF